MAATLSPVWWMIGGAIGSAAFAGALVAPDVRAALILGMVAPLAAAVVSYTAVDSMYRHNPLRVTSVMLRAWGAKAVFFLAYVTAVLQGLGVTAEPFVISLTAYFVALHAAEAVLLRRLFSGAWRNARS